MTRATIIRPAGFQDAGTIFSLIRACPDHLLPRALGDLIQNIDRCLVAESANAVVGTISWQILPEIGVSGNPSVEIKSLAVRDINRGQGIGRQLVTEAIRRIAVFRPREIIVLTFSPEFFARFGFGVTPKERLMHKLYMGCMNCTRFDSPFTCPEVAMALAMPSADASDAGEGIA